MDIIDGKFAKGKIHGITPNTQELPSALFVYLFVAEYRKQSEGFPCTAGSIAHFNAYAQSTC